MKNYLEFERDIKDLEEELEKLKDPYNKEGLSEVETGKISQLLSEINEKLKKVQIIIANGSVEKKLLITHFIKRIINYLIY